MSMRVCSGRSAPGTRGGPTSSRPPPRPRLRAGLTALAAFHQVLARDQVRGPSPGLQARFHELNWLIAGRVRGPGRGHRSGTRRIRPGAGTAMARPGTAGRPSRPLDPAPGVGPRRGAATLPARCTPRASPVHGRAGDRPRRFRGDGDRVRGGRPRAAPGRVGRRGPLGTRRRPGCVFRRPIPGRRRVGPAQGLRRLGRPARRRPLGPLAFRRGTRLPAIPRRSSGAWNEASIGRPDCSDTVGRPAERVAALR